MGIDYEQGLEQLKQYLQGTAWGQEFLVYQARLRENLHRERQYGTDEQIRSDRARIIDQLNRLAMQVNTTFNDLCLNYQAFPEQTPLEAAGIPRASLTTIWNVPYPRNPLFTGREAELKAIEAVFSEGQHAAIGQAISGLGGIGKTQLALEYAYRHRNNYRFVFWALANTRDTLNAAYGEIANLLNLPERQQREQQRIVEAVKNWLTMHHDWLLILDNADDLPMVRDFLPTSAPGHILLTTRAHAMGRLAERIEIKKLEAEEGISFLLRRSTLLRKNAPLETLDAATREAAREVVRELDGLPLALDQAGAYIEETSCSLQDYLELYRTRRAELLRRRGGLVDDHPKPVAATWQLAFDHIEASNAAAADLLRLCAFLAPDDIPEAIIGQEMTELTSSLQQLVGNPLQLNAALAVLQSYSLITRHPDTRTLDMHRLVQVVLRDAMPKEIERTWAECAVQVMDHLFPWPEEANWDVCRHLLPHTQACAVLIRGWQMKLLAGASLLRNVGWYLFVREVYGEAQEYSEQALAICRAVLGEQHPSTITILNNLGVLFVQQGKYEEAESLLRQVLAAYETQQITENPNAALIQNNLGILLVQQGKYTEAEPSLQQALAIYEAQQMAENPNAALSLNNLGELYVRQGKYDEAESLFRQALAIYEDRQMTEYLNTAVSLNNLGMLLIQQGKYTEAELPLQQALAIYEAQQMADHPNAALIQNNLAMLLIDQGKYAEAEPSVRRALAIYEAQQMADHPNTAFILTNLAAIYMHEDQYIEAEDSLKRALAIYEGRRMAEHPNTALILTYLAQIYVHQDKYIEAEGLLERALKISEQHLGSEHLTTAVIWNCMADLAKKQKRYADAETLYQRVLQIREKRLGPDHLEVASVVYDLAQLYYWQDKNAKAKPLYLRVLEIRQQKLGPDHLDLTYPLIKLGDIYRLGFWSEFAVQLYQRAWEIREKQLGASHADTQMVQKKYIAQKRFINRLYFWANSVFSLLFIAGLTIWFFHKHDLLGWIAIGLAILSALRLALGGYLYLSDRFKRKNNYTSPQPSTGGSSNS